MYKCSLWMRSPNKPSESTFMAQQWWKTEEELARLLQCLNWRLATQNGDILTQKRRQVEAQMSAVVLLDGNLIGTTQNIGYREKMSINCIPNKLSWISINYNNILQTTYAYVFIVPTTNCCIGYDSTKIDKLTYETFMDKVSAVSIYSWISDIFLRTTSKNICLCIE